MSTSNARPGPKATGQAQHEGMTCAGGNHPPERVERAKKWLTAHGLPCTDDRLETVLVMLQASASESLLAILPWKERAIAIEKFLADLTPGEWCDVVRALLRAPSHTDTCSRAVEVILSYLRGGRPGWAPVVREAAEALLGQNAESVEVFWGLLISLNRRQLRTLLNRLPAESTVAPGG
jgi:hypothetical protein